MREQLLAKIQNLYDMAPDVSPVVTLDEYFSGNTDEECIAPNQFGYGRPSLAELYTRFQEIQRRPDVQAVMVGIHGDWDEALKYEDTWPAGENVHILTSATEQEVESWIEGMQADGVIEGWPYGEHPSAPKPHAGFRVWSVCWD